MLALTLFSRWEKDAIFVFVTAYVDESGTGGEPRMMLAGVVQRTHKWHRFNNRWNRLLKEKGAPYFHLTAMENEEPPFGDWGLLRTGKFLLAALPILNDETAFGMTVAIDHAVYRSEYREKLHPSAHKDSAYGVCARMLIEAIAMQAKAFWGPETVVNFVFENSKHFGEVLRVFSDSKAHVTDLAPHLGKIAPGEKAEFCGLQAADLHVATGRRHEPTTAFKKVEVPFTSLAAARKAAQGETPFFHIALAAANLQSLREQVEMISREKKWAKRHRGYAKRDAKRLA